MPLKNENSGELTLPQQREAHASGHKHTVVMVLQGGLGSQLFEWAFAEELRRRGTRVVVDTSRCHHDSSLEIEPLIDGWPRLPRTLGIATTVLSRHDRYSRWGGYVVERAPGYDPTLLEQAATGRSVVGYFQTPRYFTAQSSYIRKKVARFSTGALTRDGLAVHRYLTGEDGFAAVHVPRVYAGKSSHHSDAEREFLDRSWEKLRAQGFRWRVWFGDDLDFASHDLAGSGDLFVNSSLMTSPAGEIALMAACRGRVLSDSSVSWWGGWLGRQPHEGGAVVAAPSEGTDDLLCDGWLVA